MPFVSEAAFDPSYQLVRRLAESWDRRGQTLQPCPFCDRVRSTAHKHPRRGGQLAGLRQRHIAERS
jgi:hypothetical protein